MYSLVDEIPSFVHLKYAYVDTFTYPRHVKRGDIDDIMSHWRQPSFLCTKDDRIFNCKEVLWRRSVMNLVIIISTRVMEELHDAQIPLGEAFRCNFMNI